MVSKQPVPPVCSLIPGPAGLAALRADGSAGPLQELCSTAECSPGSLSSAAMELYWKLQDCSAAPAQCRIVSVPEKKF